jgi:hypothetical protein
VAIKGSDRGLIGAAFRDQEGDLITDVFNPKTGMYERFVNGRSIGVGLHPNAGKVPR